MTVEFGIIRAVQFRPRPKGLLGRLRTGLTGHRVSVLRGATGTGKRDPWLLIVRRAGTVAADLRFVGGCPLGPGHRPGIQEGVLVAGEGFESSTFGL